MALERRWDLYLLNRGRRNVGLDGARTIVGDITDPDKIAPAIRDQHFDVVVNWIAFKPEDVERDIALFSGKTRQYIFISSASAYQKPPSYHIITESTPLANPYWNYSQDKIACELRLLEEYRATISLAQGIRKTLKWFDDDPSRQKINPKKNELLDAIIARRHRGN